MIVGLSDSQAERSPGRMIVGPRVVIDTNALTRHLLRPNTTAGGEVCLANGIGRVLASDATLMELADLLSRRKFDPM